MTTINDTVAQAMQANGLGGYANNVAPVVTALVNREQEIVGNLLTFASNSDLDVSAVRASLAEAGMHMPVEQVAATPAAAAGGDTDLAQTLANINQTLQGLTQFARSHGFRG